MPLDILFPPLFVFFLALFEEGESQVIVESQNLCMFLFEKSREAKMILFDM